MASIFFVIEKPKCTFVDLVCQFWGQRFLLDFSLDEKRFDSADWISMFSRHRFVEDFAVGGTSRIECVVSDCQPNVVESGESLRLAWTIGLTGCRFIQSGVPVFDQFHFSDYVGYLSALDLVLQSCEPKADSTAESSDGHNSPSNYQRPALFARRNRVRENADCCCECCTEQKRPECVEDKWCS